MHIKKSEIFKLLQRLICLTKRIEERIQRYELITNIKVTIDNQRSQIEIDLLVSMANENCDKKLLFKHFNWKKFRKSGKFKSLFVRKA